MISDTQTHGWINIWLRFVCKTLIWDVHYIVCYVGTDLFKEPGISIFYPAAGSYKMVVFICVSSNPEDCNLDTTMKTLYLSGISQFIPLPLLQFSLHTKIAYEICMPQQSHI
jgi:hypothetical protein